MRRTPEATDDSWVILNRPMSPERRTWVPPHSSVDSGCTVTTRTLLAVLLAEQRHRAGRLGLGQAHDLACSTSSFSRIQPFTRSSTRSSCSSVSSG